MGKGFLRKVPIQPYPTKISSENLAYIHTRRIAPLMGISPPSILGIRLMEATVDEFIFTGTRIGCRVLDLIGADGAKASLCAPAGEFRYLVGLVTWLLVVSIAGKLVSFFFGPRPNKTTSNNG